MTELARITPAQRVVRATGGLPARPVGAVPAVVLSSRQKAAVIVRLLLAEGAAPNLSTLPDDLQTGLAEQIGQMRLVDRATLTAVVEEFLEQLEQVGLSFPGGVEGALSIMDGHISANAASRLRRMAGEAGGHDPWVRLSRLPPEQLMPILETESAEVAAVALSKLPVSKAADLLSQLPGERARRLAYIMSLTGDIAPEAVARIGAALAGRIESAPPRAFDSAPAQRIGAILNSTTARARDDLLQALQDQDAGFAEKVRRAIFTFAQIPERIAPRDVAAFVRRVDQPVMVAAFAAAAALGHQPVLDFLTANMSQRLAQTLRDEAADLPRPSAKDGEAALAAVVATIRDMVDAGELTMLQPEED